MRVSPNRPEVGEPLIVTKASRLPYRGSDPGLTPGSPAMLVEADDLIG